MTGTGRGAELLDKARAVARMLAEGAIERDRDRRFPHEELAAIRETGLLTMLVPEEHGGAGASVSDMVRVIGALAEGDPSVAQILIVHNSGVELLNKVAPEHARLALYERLVGQKLLLTNAYTEVGTKTIFDFKVRIRPDGDGWRINGSKAYCTGSLGGDVIFGLAVSEEEQPRPLVFLIDADAEGVTIHDDWTGFGQRTTASGTIEFHDASVAGELVFPPDRLMEHPLENFFGTNGQAMMSALFVGIARNALADAVVYARERARPWVHSGVEKASLDPYVMHTIGRMQTLVNGADALVERALELIDAAVADTTAETRAAASLAVADAKAASTEASLAVSELMFNVGGAGMTVGKYGFDRHWRNARTLTLHDPVDYKFRLSGDYLLNDEAPPISSHTP